MSESGLLSDCAVRCVGVAPSSSLCRYLSFDSAKLLTCGVVGGECRSSDRVFVGEDESACLEEKSERVMALRSVSKKMSFVVACWMVDEPYRSLACSCLVKEERGSFT